MSKRSTYHGDTDAKRLMRARAWLACTNTLALSYGVRSGGAFCLAGHGGDISTLLGFGVAPSSIYAVDRAEDCVEYCSELYPRVNVLRGLASDVCAGVDYRMAHLDFCSGLTVDNIATVIAVAKRANLGGHHVGYMLVTMLRGREPSHDNGPILLGSRAERRRHLHEIRRGYRAPAEAQLYRRGKFSPKLCLREVEREVSDAGLPPGVDEKEWGRFMGSSKRTLMGTSILRARAMQELVNPHLEEHDRMICLCLILGYNSEHPLKKKGSPFVTCGYVIGRPSQYERHERTLFEAPHTGGYDPHMCDVMGSKDSRSSLEGFAMSFLATGFGVKRTAQVLGVAPEELLAWRSALRESGVCLLYTSPSPRDS